MKYLVLLMSIVSLEALAKTEFVEVKKVLSSSDKVIIVRPNGEEWIVDKGIGCLSISRYEHKKIIASFSIDPNSVGAKLIIPDSDQECRIWSAEEIE